jgi:charged multivesicular body protein 7
LNHAAVSGQLSADHSFLLHPDEAFLTGLSSPQYGRPLGLGAVIDEGIRSGQVVLTKEFLDSQRSIYSKRWAPSPWTVLQWGLRQVGFAGLTGSYEAAGGKALKSTTFALVEALEKIANEVSTIHANHNSSLTDRIITRSAFAAELSTLRGHPIPHSDLQVLLRFLARDKQILSYDAQTIKFTSPSHPIPTPITEQDTTIASLSSLITTLDSQCANLTTRIATLTSKAHTAISTHPPNRASALAALRSRAFATQTLTARSATLAQLQETLAAIESAADNLEIVLAMEASASVLKSLNQQVGGAEKVADIVHQLRVEMEKVDEVAQVVNEPLNAAQGLDEGDVEDELEAMERDEARKRAAAEEEREAAEAEKTRRTLEEVERPTDSAAARVDHAAIPNRSAEMEEHVREGADRLSGLSIEDQGRGSMSAEHA